MQCGILQKSSLLPMQEPIVWLPLSKSNKVMKALHELVAFHFLDRSYWNSLSPNTTEYLA